MSLYRLTYSVLFHVYSVVGEQPLCNIGLAIDASSKEQTGIYANSVFFVLFDFVPIQY